MFEGRRVVGVVNSKVLDAHSTQKEVHGWLELAERLGSLQSQLLRSNLLRCSVVTRGPLLHTHLGLVVAATLKGVLKHMVTDVVNYVNAPVLAQEFGLKIEESHSNEPSKYLNSISITFHSDEGVKNIGVLCCVHAHYLRRTCSRTHTTHPQWAP